MESTARWTPNDWLRLVALLGGLAIFVIGCWMLFQGIKAEGQVDLKSTVLSGTLKASSAGLYICFFALFIIIFSLATLLAPQSKAEAKPGSNSSSRGQRLRPVFWGLLAALALCALGAAFLPEGVRTTIGMAVGVLVMSLSSVVFAMIRMAYDDEA